MGTDSMKRDLLEAKTAFINLNPMIKSQAGPVMLPMMRILEGLTEALTPGACLGDCKGCGTDCPARGV